VRELLVTKLQLGNEKLPPRLRDYKHNGKMIALKIVIILLLIIKYFQAIESTIKGGEYGCSYN